MHPPVNRDPGWYRDVEGVLTTTQHVDETRYYTFDYSRQMDSSETISTSTWESSGVTTANTTSTSTTASVKVTGTGGYIKNTLVTTGGTVARTLVYLYRILAAPVGRQERYVA